MSLFSGVVFTWFVILVGVALAIVGVRALIQRRTAWRWMISLPLLLVLGVVLRIVRDVRADPTSHNLWPFEVLVTLCAAAGLLGLLELIRLGIQRWYQTDAS